MLIIIIIAVCVWMLTGFYQVQPGNQGVVQRFGKHVQTVGDGLGLAPAVAHRNRHQGRRRRRQIHVEYKSRVLTAEPNMVELQVAVQYRIKHAEDYLFKVRDPSSHAERSQRERHSRSGRAATTSRPSSKRAASRSPRTRA